MLFAYKRESYLIQNSAPLAHTHHTVTDISLLTDLSQLHCVRDGGRPSVGGTGWIVLEMDVCKDHCITLRLHSKAFFSQPLHSPPQPPWLSFHILNSTLSSPSDHEPGLEKHGRLFKFPHTVPAPTHTN